MKTNRFLLQKKYARVVSLFSKKYNIGAVDALEKFYKSNLYHLVNEGISDLHCMSDDYLVEELHEEWSESKYYNTCFVKVENNVAVIRFISKENLHLTIKRIVFWNSNNEKIKEETAVRLVVIHDQFNEQRFQLPDNAVCNSIQFTIKNDKYQEQHSVTVGIDGVVFARKMLYNE